MSEDIWTDTVRPAALPGAFYRLLSGPSGPSLLTGFRRPEVRTLQAGGSGTGSGTGSGFEQGPGFGFARLVLDLALVPALPPAFG